MALPRMRLFVYGSLLPGQPMWPRIRDRVLGQEPATIRGQLYWHACGRFPIARDTPGAGISGRVLTLPHDIELYGLLAAEEMGFGYDARWVTPHRPDGSPLPVALAFLWPWNALGVGPEIESGRWEDVAGMPMPDVSSF